VLVSAFFVRSVRSIDAKDSLACSKEILFCETSSLTLSFENNRGTRLANSKNKFEESILSSS
jgi:hypothetical protein